ncbi:DUF2884 family protein [Veronia pacifica]|uniref:DUF2884 domain-containing protein n=1 Tax=Veronia pacifica TaxID=1080227 RepID=A0A1C3EIX6_9GAMM|nr:DUF2884 family protein [Veronia pacifica]ODA33185.1 hypothetical protein A8L45_11225 [Veronia pacifica]
MNLRILCLLGMVFPAMVSATDVSQCQPTLHSDIALKDGNIIGNSEHGEFSIAEDGALFFAVHPVKLTQAQKTSLKIYSQTVRDDLPYMGQGLMDEIQTSWLALDEVLENQLGKRSILRNELGHYHIYLQKSFYGAIYDKDKTIKVDHRRLNYAMKEMGMTLPQFITTIPRRGLMDFQRTTKTTAPEKLMRISDDIAVLQSKLRMTINDEKSRSASFIQDVCARLSVWQRQEEKIQSLIPALSSWKTVTVNW